jgi:hypothetical protein
MSDVGGLLKGFGAALSGTAQSMMQLKELERRAKADAKRLQITMERLDIAKQGAELDAAHQEWSRKFQEAEAKARREAAREARIEGYAHDLKELTARFNLMGLHEGTKSGYRTKEMGVEHGYDLEKMEKGYGYDVGLIGERGKQTRMTEGHKTTLRSQLEQGLMGLRHKYDLDKMTRGYQHDLGLVGARGSEARKTAGHKSTLGAKPKFELEPSMLNAAIRYAQERTKYQKAQPFGFYFNQAINNIRSVADPDWSPGPYGIRGSAGGDKLRQPVPKKKPPPEKEITKEETPDEEIARLKKELGIK